MRDRAEALVTRFKQTGNRTFKAVLEDQMLRRKIVRRYYWTRFNVVEVEVLMEHGVPVAVTRQVLGPDHFGDVLDEENVREKLKTFALDAPELQLGDEFEGTVRLFETE